MNLAELVEKVEEELDYAPDSTAHLDKVVRKLNDVYLDIMGRFEWPFLETLWTLTTHPDIPVAGPGAFVANSRQVGVGIASAADVTWDGAHLVNGAGDRYEIADAHRYTPIGNPNIWLTTPYTGLGGGWAFSVNHYSYMLPLDCVRVLGIMDRENDRGLVAHVALPVEKRLVLNDDEQSGYPQVWLPEPQAQDRAPRTALVGAASAPPLGALPDGVYRYFYAFYVAGRYSGRSNIVTVTVAGANDGVDLSVMETQFVKHVFREDNRSGFFRYICELGEANTTVTDDGTAPYTPNDDLVWDPVGQYKRLRLWPRPNAEMDLEVRYLRRPHRLYHDNDCPDFPEQYHQLLVHFTAAQLAARADDKLAGTETRLGTVILDRMINMYGLGDERRWQKQKWGGSSGFGSNPDVGITYT